MNRSKISFLVYCSIIITSMPLVAAEDGVSDAKQTISQPRGASAPSPARRVMLTGRVENQDRLPPVDPTLRSGASFDVARLSKLKGLSSNNHWDRIPQWAAGTWRKKTSTTYYVFDYGTRGQTFDVETGMALSAETRGWQQDKQNNIWEYGASNFFTKTECENTWHINFVKDVQALEIVPDRMILGFVAVRVVVDKGTRTILSSHQMESIQTYTPVADGLVKINGSIKQFDEDGKPLYLAKIICFERRVLPFQPVDFDEGRNMQALFAEYLNSHGNSELIPVSHAARRAGLPPSKSKS